MKNFVLQKKFFVEIPREYVWMSAANAGQICHTFFSKMFKSQIFIAIFESSMKNTLKWVQTSLVLEQWFLRYPLEVLEK